MEMKRLCFGALSPAPVTANQGSLPRLNIKVSFKQCLIRSPWRWLLLPLLVMVFRGGQLAFFSPEVRNRFSRPGNVVLLGIDPIGANADPDRRTGGALQPATTAAPLFRSAILLVATALFR